MEVTDEEIAVLMSHLEKMEQCVTTKAGGLAVLDGGYKGPRAVEAGLEGSPGSHRQVPGHAEGA